MDANIQRALNDKLYDKRKIGALEYVPPPFKPWFLTLGFGYLVGSVWPACLVKLRFSFPVGEYAITQTRYRPPLSLYLTVDHRLIALSASSGSS